MIRVQEKVLNFHRFRAKQRESRNNYINSPLITLAINLEYTSQKTSIDKLGVIHYIKKGLTTQHSLH